MHDPIYEQKEIEECTHGIRPKNDCLICFEEEKIEKEKKEKENANDN